MSKMKVVLSGEANVIDLYRGNLPKRAATPGGNAPSFSGHVAISQNGKDLQSIMFSLKALPDVRGNMVTMLKQQVAAAPTGLTRCR